MAETPRKNGARGLLFTLLGEFVLPSGGWGWTSAFIEVFGRLGVEEKTARQALARTAADGWISPEKHGRRTRWLLTDAGRRLLTEGTERIFAALRDAGGPSPDSSRYAVRLGVVPC